MAQQLIERAQNIVLATHEEPDGDGLGSMLALGGALEKLNKKVNLFCPSPIGGEFRFLPQIERVKNELIFNGVDLIVGLDYGDLKRLGLGGAAELAAFNFLTFDHHLGLASPGLAIIGQNLSLIHI